MRNPAIAFFLFFAFLFGGCSCPEEFVYTRSSNIAGGSGLNATGSGSSSSTGSGSGSVSGTGTGTAGTSAGGSGSGGTTGGTIVTNASRPSENGIFLVNTTADFKPSGKAENLYTTHSILSKNGRYLFVAVNEMSAISEVLDDPVFPDIGGYLLKIDLQTGTKKVIKLSQKGTLRDGDFLIYNYNVIDVSEDGRYILFSSFDNRILEQDDFNPPQSGGAIYRIDTELNTIEVVNKNPDGSRVEGYWARFAGGPDKIVFQDDQYQKIITKNLLDNTADELNATGFAFGLEECFVSDDGQNYVFPSADNLENLPNPFNLDDQQIYLYNVPTQKIELVSKKPDGSLPLNSSWSATISGDGKFVAFTSNDNLLDPNVVAPVARTHLYLYDVAKKEIRLLATERGPDGRPDEVDAFGICLSPDGRYVAYLRDAAWGPGFLKERPVILDVQTGSEVDLASLIPNPELLPEDFVDNNIDFRFSADGKLLSFVSRRSDGLAYSSAYIYNIETGQLRDILTEMGIFQSSDVRSFKGSGDGTQVVFSTNDRLNPELYENIHQARYGQYNVYLASIVDGALQELTVHNDGSPYQTSSSDHVTECASTDISDDGQTSIFVSHFSLDPDPEDTIGVTHHYPADVFLKKANTPGHVLVSKDLAVNESVRGAAISGDGKKVAFSTTGEIYVAGSHFLLYLYDVETDTYRLLRIPDKFDVDTGDVYVGLDLSEDGNILTYVRQVYRTVNFDDILIRRDVMRYDIKNDVLETVTSSANDESGIDDITQVSNDGRYVLFTTRATNLDPRDTNGVADVYRYDSTDGTFEVMSLLPDGTSSASESAYPSMSGDGRYVTFSSRDTAFAGSSTVRNSRNVYVKDTQTGNVALVSKPSGQNSQTSSSDLSQLTTDGTKILFRAFGGGIVEGANPYSSNVLITANPLLVSP